MRVYKDNTGISDVWFEVEPDVFVNAPNFEDAKVFRTERNYGADLESVNMLYGPMRFQYHTDD